ncbi:MAG: hypothetical protein KatS3mg033_0682 [Thermonema sp.]|nr:MAG: hypothetical protein KatS3mg033_0682 [Thermonema sp.]
MPLCFVETYCGKKHYLKDHASIYCGRHPSAIGRNAGQRRRRIVYEVNNHPARTPLVAKVFFSPEKAAQKEAKLRYMVQNPPESIEQNGHTFLAWPLELLFDEQGQFTGFLMPKAEGVELEYLCSDDFESYPEFQSTEWHKFYFSNPMVAVYRLRTAFNICAAVHAVHAKGYVIGDLKPVNIFVLPNGLHSLIGPRQHPNQCAGNTFPCCCRYSRVCPARKQRHGSG